MKEKLLLFLKESSVSMNAKQKKWGVREKSSLGDALNGQRKTRDFSPTFPIFCVRVHTSLVSGFP